jgi:hypothetical protein
MLRVILRSLVVSSAASLAVSALSQTATAWDNHTVPARVALESLPEIKNAPLARVEPLEDFVEAEASGLEKALADEELWARQNIHEYKPLPVSLAFHAVNQGTLPRREQFLRAIRINPTVRVALFTQALPGEKPRAPFPWQKISILEHAPAGGRSSYSALQPGDLVPALEIAATAADEPDYGHDIGLWQDSGTPFGEVYGFGKQPFGNPAISISSQVPFHIGYYHESAIIFKAAPFLKQTYPEMRAHQFLQLARLAHSSGHAYWGWRFAGWATHYLQDLTQPYHATVLPGVSTVRMLWINALNLAGIKGPQREQIQLVSNRHFAFENFGLGTLLHAIAHGIEQNGPTSPVLIALGRPGTPSFYEDSQIRQVISERSHARADDTNHVLVESLPARWVNDPGYIYGETEPSPDIRDYLEHHGTPEERRQLDDLLVAFMGEFGVHTRNLIKAALPKPPLKTSAFNGQNPEEEQ